MATVAPLKQFAFTMRGEVESLKACQKAMEASEAYNAMPPALQFVAELVLDELVTNAIKYGGPGDRVIDCEFTFDGRELILTLSDNGLPFDPWSVPPIAALDTEDIDTITVGGRGIHMLRNATDERTYERAGGKNVVRIIRGIRPPQNWMKAA